MAVAATRYRTGMKWSAFGSPKGSEGAAGAAGAAPPARPQDAADPAVAYPALARLAMLLWSGYLRFDAADPTWFDRDRCVAAEPAAAGLLHLLATLSSSASGAPVPPASAPADEGLGTAVGLALAERTLAARFGRSLVDHRTWVFVGADELACGASHEAAAIAGEWRLDRLTALHVGPAAALAELGRRFQAAGWAVRECDGADAASIASALSFTLRSRKPNLVLCHEAPGPDAPPPAHAHDWATAGLRGAPARRAWLRRLAQHPLRAEFERACTGRRAEEPRELLEAGLRDIGDDPAEALTAALPDALRCIGLPAASRPGAAPRADGVDGFRLRRLEFGPRIAGMAAALNGIALHGGWRPIGQCRVTDSDHLRASLRRAAARGQAVVHVLSPPATPGATGGTAEGAWAADSLAALRAIEGLFVFLPADAAEAATCWHLALRRRDGPSVLILGDRATLPLPPAGAEDAAARGGYLRRPAPARRAATLIAAGDAVPAACAAAAALDAQGPPVAVVSLPCWELFAQQDEAYRAMVLGDAPRIGIETGSGFGWERWLGRRGSFIRLGAAPGWTGDVPTPISGHDVTTIIEAVQACMPQ